MAASQKRAPDLRRTARSERLDVVMRSLYLEASDDGLDSRAQETARRWLSKARPDGSDQSPVRTIARTIILATDLELFTPSMSGTTQFDRLARRRTMTEDEREAFALLKRARFAPLRVLSVDSETTFSAKDLATGLVMSVADEAAFFLAPGVVMVVRVLPLSDGSFSTIGPITPLDEAGLAVALDFVRPGKGLINEQRCAAAVYRHVVRHGGPAIPGVDDPLDESRVDDEPEYDGVAINELDLLLPAFLPNANGEPPAEDALDALRTLASTDYVVGALFRVAATRMRVSRDIGSAYRQMAEELMVTLVQRAQAGSGRDPDPLEMIARAIEREVATRGYPPEAATLFHELRQTVAARTMPKAKAGASPADDALGRVIERIRALRAKTIDQGCTEEEAMAAANKAAELLDRYGLSLSEIDLRQQTCEGIGIDSTRKRSGPVDQCFPAVAHFCDCKAWQERTAADTIRSVFFGLPADVEAARFIYERVVMTFETETKVFQRGAIYAAMSTGKRRTATNSFQLGLARGICLKLASLKGDRDAAFQSESGRDLVAVKTSVIDEDLAKLGLVFTSRPMSGSRNVLVAAFEAGQVAGHRFEARETIEKS